jgi:hypothetical protein
MKSAERHCKGCPLAVETLCFGLYRLLEWWWRFASTTISAIIDMQSATVCTLVYVRTGHYLFSFTRAGLSYSDSHPYTELTVSYDFFLSRIVYSIDSGFDIARATF